MQTQLKVKLSFFNFLQYFVWGSWYASMGAYLTQPPLNFDGQEVGLAYGAFAIGSMISPFLVGLLADRYFASEKLLAVFSLVGGAVLCVLPSLKTHAGTRQFAGADPLAGCQDGVPACETVVSGRLDWRRRDSFPDER